MLIKNNSKRLYTLNGVKLVPGAPAIEVKCEEADIAGLDDLEVVKAKAEEKPSLTKAELQDALEAKKIEYPSTANKAELQALLDAAE